MISNLSKIISLLSNTARIRIQVCLISRGKPIKHSDKLPQTHKKLFIGIFCPVSFIVKYSHPTEF